MVWKAGKILSAVEEQLFNELCEYFRLVEEVRPELIYDLTPFPLVAFYTSHYPHLLRSVRLEVEVAWEVFRYRVFGLR